MNREIFVFYLSKDSTAVAATIEALKGCLSFSLPLKPQAAGRGEVDMLCDGNFLLKMTLGKQ